MAHRRRRGALRAMSNPLVLGKEFPNYPVKTTHGNFMIHDFLHGKVDGHPGSWTCFFCHPADFTPVCTSECAKLHSIAHEFSTRGCNLIGISCGSIESHTAWAADILHLAAEYDPVFGAPLGNGALAYPLIADDRTIVAELGMIDGEICEENGLPYPDRTLLLMKGNVIKFMLAYPVFSGRSFDEVLRVLDSIQEADRSPRTQAPVRSLREAQQDCRAAVDRILDNIPSLSDGTGDCLRKAFAEDVDACLRQGVPLTGKCLGTLAGCQQFNGQFGEVSTADAANLEAVLQALRGPGCQVLEVRIKARVVLPSCVCQMSNLVSLNLSNCINLAALPAALGQLRALEVLNLFYCLSLTALPVSIGQLTNLRELTMTSCVSMLLLPHTIGQLTRLTTLNLSHSSRLTELPACLGLLASLEQLCLSGCWGLTAVPEALGGLSSLTDLCMSNCSGIVSLPGTLEGLGALRSFNLNGCSRLIAVPEGVARMRALRELDLSFCSKLKTVPKGVLELSRLKRLNVFGCGDLVGALRKTAGCSVSSGLCILGMQAQLEL